MMLEMARWSLGEPMLPSELSLYSTSIRNDIIILNYLIKNTYFTDHIHITPNLNKPSTTTNSTIITTMPIIIIMHFFFLARYSWILTFSIIFKLLSISSFAFLTSSSARSIFSEFSKTSSPMSYINCMHYFTC